MYILIQLLPKLAHISKNPRSNFFSDGQILDYRFILHVKQKILVNNKIWE